MYKWQVTKKERGLRLIYFLKEKFPPNYSARFWKRAIEKNLCKVNGYRERFGSKVLQINDVVELEPNWQKRMDEKSTLSFSPIYEDEQIVVINKPSGLVCEDKYFSPFVLIHRLDKETSGLLLLAKTKEAKDKMMALFQERKILKRYLAVVEGSVKKEVLCGW